MRNGRPVRWTGRPFLSIVEAMKWSFFCAAPGVSAVFFAAFLLTAKPPVMVATQEVSTLEVSTADSRVSHETPAAHSEGTALWYHGESREAVEWYRRFVAENPRDSDARISLVLLLRETGRMDEAAEVARGLPPGEQGHYRATAMLAGITIEAGDPRGAEGDASLTAHELLWAGIQRYYSRRLDEARDLLHAAVLKDPALAYAHAYLGYLAMDELDWEGAVTHLEAARAREPNLTALLQHLGEATYRQGDVIAALRLLERARIAMPWDIAVGERLVELQNRHRDRLVAASAAAAQQRMVVRPPQVSHVAVDREIMPWVRVALAEGLRSVHLRVGGPFSIVAVSPDLVLRSGLERRAHVGELATVSRPMTLHIVYRRSGGSGGSGDAWETVVTDEQTGAVLVTTDQPVRIVPENPRDTTIIFDMVYGHGQFASGREDRSYRGEIELLPRGEGAHNATLTVINDLPVEEYLYSVVPSEMPAWWPEAALEAQAVAARSYTLHPRRRFHERGFDLLSSVLSAYYRGVAGEHQRTTRAVDATRGLVLLDGRRPLDAVYSANTAGITESSASVWGSVTALVGVRDPLLSEHHGSYLSPAELYRWIQDRPDSFSGRSPWAFPAAYRWNLLVAAEDIQRRLAAAGMDVGPIQAVLPGRRGPSGRVEDVLVVGADGEATVRRDAIRSRLGGLRSNLFMVTPQVGADGTVERFLFEGAGWGHGVGMCQTGAAAMADARWSSARILAHYYPGAPVTSWF